MQDLVTIITSEFFWGILVGLALSLIGSYALANFNISITNKHQKERVREFCIDTIRNINNTIMEMDKIRDRSKSIHHDFLAILESEILVYSRNREHLIVLPDNIRSDVRTFMNEIAIKRAEITQQLQEFYRISNLADQIRSEGRAPESERLRAESELPLAAAHRAMDKLVQVSTNSTHLIPSLRATQVR